MSLMVHAASVTVGSSHSATVTSVDGRPNAMKYAANGGSELLAGMALCRRLVEEGYDPETNITLPVLNAANVTKIGRAV